METPDWLRRFADESNKIEGMGPANNTEIEALKSLLAPPLISVEALERYVAAVAPGKKLRRRAGMNVRVGNHIAPSGGPDIEVDLQNLCGVANNSADPYLVHVAYEKLHPFMDGNGRSGRALWLWMHLYRGTEAAAQQLGFLHSFYYETLSHSRATP